jgi:peptidyl-prolyl cis-trans isomerase B (cyclophilin B)
MAGFWRKLRGQSAPAPQPGESADEVAVLATTAGEMVIEFWPDVAPETVANFKRLAREGFFDGTRFHRVIQGFMIQGGDPLTKDPTQAGLWGTGGPGYTIKAEFNDRPHLRGVISMARADDPDSAGSQFFICLAECPFLDGQYTAFGRLIGGDEALGRIGDSPVVASPDDELSRPVEPVSLRGVRLVPRSALP